MSKHKKPAARATNKNRAAPLPPANLEQQARQALESKQYKQAIQHLKTLLKQAGDSAQVVAWLQVAYTGRAGQLADQGMLKEAITIWEAAAPYGLKTSDPRYLGWLMKAKQYSRLLTLYRQLPTGQQLLQAHLAAAALSGEAALLASLPEDDPVRSGYVAANSLLEAWCAGADKEQLQAQLQAIPFRSPYRDLRQAIQAWLWLEESAPAQVADTLARIAPDSPFHPLAEQVRLAQLDRPELLPQLAGITPAAHACQLAVRGWSSPPLTSLLKKLEILGDEPNVSGLFAFLSGLDVRQAPALLQHWRRDMLKKAWVIGAVNASPPLKPSQLERAIGVPPQLEKDHLHALTHTTNDSPVSELLRVWGHYQDKLLAEGKADSPLAAAQIERYLAGEREKQAGKPTRYSTDLLQQSLGHDPSSAEIWAKVLEYYLQQQQLKPARDALKEALAHHPDAIALLELGIRIALAGSAFKKAASYAGRILGIDPINTRVRQYLQNAHIAHARKQIKQQKWQLVDKELREARQWKSTPLNATLIQVLQACAALMQGNAESARQILAPLGKGLATSAAVRLDFILRHESALTMTPLPTLLQAAGLEDVWKKPHTTSILVLVDTARQFQETSPDGSMATLAVPLDKLRSILLKAAHLPFTTAEGEKLCEFWLQAGQDALLDKYATALEKAHPDKPLFTYYRFVNVDPFEAWRAVPKLEDAWEQAINQGDVAASSRIGGLLDRLANPYPELDDDEDSFDAFEDAMADMGEEGAMGLMAELVPMMPLSQVLELAYEMLDKKTVRLILERFGEKAVRDLCQSFLRGDDPQTFIEQLVSGHNPPYTGRLF